MHYISHRDKFNAGLRPFFCVYQFMNRSLAIFSNCSVSEEIVRLPTIRESEEPETAAIDESKIPR